MLYFQILFYGLRKVWIYDGKILKIEVPLCIIVTIKTKNDTKTTKLIKK